MEKKPIKSFHDLIVYKNLYSAMLTVMKDIAPALPKEEKYDLSDQMRRSAKAAPALIAEGFAKRYQKNYWRKYIVDTLGECNEMIHHLSICIDVYGQSVDVAKCNTLRELYTTTCKQLTKLGQSWQNYHDSRS